MSRAKDRGISGALLGANLGCSNWLLGLCEERKVSSFYGGAWLVLRGGKQKSKIALLVFVFLACASHAIYIVCVTNRDKRSFFFMFFFSQFFFYFNYTFAFQLNLCIGIQCV